VPRSTVPSSSHCTRQVRQCESRAVTRRKQLRKWRNRHGCQKDRSLRMQGRSLHAFMGHSLFPIARARVESAPRTLQFRRRRIRRTTANPTGARRISTTRFGSGTAGVGPRNSISGLQNQLLVSLQPSVPNCARLASCHVVPGDTEPGGVPSTPVDSNVTWFTPKPATFSSPTKYVVPPTSGIPVPKTGPPRVPSEVAKVALPSKVPPLAGRSVKTANVIVRFVPRVSKMVSI
jgi:hypothetical protein